jgi:hypothetical protein
MCEVKKYLQDISTEIGILCNTEIIIFQGRGHLLLSASLSDSLLNQLLVSFYDISSLLVRSPTIFSTSHYIFSLLVVEYSFAVS